MSMVLAFILSSGIPILIYADAATAFMMITTGSILSVIFVAIAFLSSIMTRDKAKGIGISIILWLYFALLFDGLVLFLFLQFSDYPIEKMVVALSVLSPVDLSRILILLRLDVSAMMGMTGAVFQKSFGTGLGLIVSFTLLLCWVLVPFGISLRKFSKQDL